MAEAAHLTDIAVVSKRRTIAPDVLHLVLPVPPSTNRLWRNRGGRTIKSLPAREYEGAVQDVLARAGLNPYRPRWAAGDVGYHLVWYRARRTGDASNRLKLIEDVLTGWVYTDDKQVAFGAFERRDDDPRHARIELWLMPAHMARTFTPPEREEMAA